jgi:GNAT superfamily N-acetyltransferase
MAGSGIKYRESTESDIPAMARLREEHWGAEEYWTTRIAGYLRGDVHPQQALPPRIACVATVDDQVVGFIAGHLTRRFGCDGELEWINVTSAYRGSGIATGLLHQLAAWFVKQEALYICVNCAADNTTAQHFYRRNGAVPLSDHWLIWKDISKLVPG